MMGVATAHAEDYDYPYLAFQTVDGSLQTVAAEGLVITFADGKLVASNGDGSRPFTLSDLSKMYFSTSAEEADAIGEVESADSPVEIYTVAGICVGRYESLKDARGSLEKGIYVVKSGSRTTKMMVR